MIFFPDVNVWVALAFAEHTHNSAAWNWFYESQRTESYVTFCRITQMGFLRLITNPTVMQEDVWKPADAWDIFDQFLKIPLVIRMDEPPGLEDHWREGTGSRNHGSNWWTDAYLTAFAAAGELTLVTFDKQLARLSPGAHLLK